MAGLTIGEVARRAGIAPSALRFYEAQKLIPSPPRRAGRRVYPREVVDRLAVIELAKRAGFTLREIADLLRGFDRQVPAAASWRGLARGKVAELEQRIERMRGMRTLLLALASCTCPTLADCGRAVGSARTS